MSLASREYKRVLDLIELIYAVPDSAAMFRSVCEDLQKLLPLQSAAFLSAVPSTGSLQFPRHLSYNVPDAHLLLFCTYYAPLHPFVIDKGVLELIDTYHNKAVSLTDVISASRLAETEYSRDFQSLHPIFYELGGALGVQGRPVGRIGLHRSKSDRDFNSKDREIINIIMPHLARALYCLEQSSTGPASLQKLDDLDLTRRQQEVALLVVEGLSNREIAERLFIGEQTVKDHLHDIFNKLGVRRRSELAVKVLNLPARLGRLR